MLWSSWQSPPALALTAVAAVLGGTLAGVATVDGLTQHRYGPADGISLFAPAEASTISSMSGNGGSSEAGCTECSERDRGYRWAVLAAVRSPDQCPVDSWNFRRGCLDFVGGI
jgi:hypothetical protein